MIRWTGKWLGGTASVQHLRTAVAWGYAPAVFKVALFILALLITGPELFTKPSAHLDAMCGRGLFYLAVGVVAVVLETWSIVTLCHTVAEVQGYRSAWRGLGNIVLSVLVPVAALVVLALILVAVIKGGAALFR
ncbi:MAG: hypothetical protein A2107_14225 [Verrucomicrobia bacterium GWF2_62_7]|nr:MAG: hypothetical protein A2107_14225 [Verrucomicrobia bacterium GWF2_62_7]